jgi:uncharacterized protein (DUF1684 family)
MKKRLPVWPSVLLSSVIFAVYSQSGATFDVSAHTEEVIEWRTERLQRLKAPQGFLNQIGLYWLKPGSYRFGAATTNDLVFAGNAAAEIGVFTVTDNGVSMAVAEGVEVLSDGVPVKDIEIPADTTNEPIMVTHGSLAWTVVERVGRYAVRLRDFEHPFVEAFGPLPYFDIDPALRVSAKLKRYAEPRIANVGTVIEGLGYHPESPGLVEFELDDQVYTLEAYTSGEHTPHHPVMMG